MEKIKNLSLLTVAFSSLVVGQAFANPTLSGSVLSELQTDYKFETDSANEENKSNTHATIEFAPELNFNNGFSVDANFVFEQIDEGNGTEDLFFERQGAYVEVLKVNYALNDNFKVFAGKFNPQFGQAYERGRGIWASTYAEEYYELAGKIGGGMVYSYEDHEVGANTFFTDTTDLSQIAFIGSNRVKESDGGAGNTESLDSFNVYWNKKNLFDVEGLSTHVAYQSLAAEDSLDDNQTGIAANVNYAFNLTSDIKTDVMVEYVNISSYDNTDEDVDALTFNVVNMFGDNWKMNLSHTTLGREAGDDHLNEISGGYVFTDSLKGLMLEVGYKHERSFGESDQDIGALATYRYEF